MTGRIWTHMVNIFFLTPQEDSTLLTLVQDLGPKKWKIIARQINHSSHSGSDKKRTGQMCKDRWVHLSKQAGSQNWDLVSEFLFFEVHSIIGNKWTDITKFLYSRTDNDLKNHFYSNLRKTLRKFSGRRGSCKKPSFDNFKEKIIAFYILKYIKSNIVGQSAEFRKSFFDTYVIKYIKKEKIQIDLIPVHLENLCQTLLDDKVVTENLQVLPDEVNCSSTSKVIHSLAYIELFRKANNFLKISPLEKFRVSQHAALKNKFSQFFKTFEDKFTDIKPDLKPSVLDFQAGINIPASSSATTSSLINNNFNFNNNVQILSPLYNLQNIFLNFKPENSENTNSNYSQQTQTQSQSQSNLQRNFQGNNNLNNELIRLFNNNYNNYQILNSNNLQNNYFNNNLLNDVCK